MFPTNNGFKIFIYIGYNLNKTVVIFLFYFLFVCVLMVTSCELDLKSTYILSSFSICSCTWTLFLVKWKELSSYLLSFTHTQYSFRILLSRYVYIILLWCLSSPITPTPGCLPSLSAGAAGGCSPRVRPATQLAFSRAVMLSGGSPWS